MFYYKNIGEMKFHNATGAAILKQNPRISSVPRRTSVLCLSTFDSPGVCPAKPQTMSGLSGAPSGTASQTI